MRLITQISRIFIGCTSYQIDSLNDMPECNLLMCTVLTGARRAGGYCAKRLRMKRSFHLTSLMNYIPDAEPQDGIRRLPKPDSRFIPIRIMTAYRMTAVVFSPTKILLTICCICIPVSIATGYFGGQYYVFEG